MFVSYDPDELTIYTGAPDTVKCGGIMFEGNLIPIYARTTTGDVVYSDPITEEGMCLGELSVDDPIPVQASRDAVDAIIASTAGVVAGVIITHKGIYRLSPGFDKAQLFGFDEAPIGEPFSIDADRLDGFEGINN